MAYVIGMGVCLVAGLVLYSTRRLSSEQINRIFGTAMVSGAAGNFVFNRTLHPLLPDAVLAIFGFMTVTGFMGLITDGVIFKFWKLGPRASTAAERTANP
jgi:lipoprotein signal peptidase